MQDLPTTFVPPKDDNDSPMPLPADNAPFGIVQQYWSLPKEYIVPFAKCKPGSWRVPRLEGLLTLMESLSTQALSKDYPMHTLVIQPSGTSLEQAEFIAIDGNHRRLVFPKFGVDTWKSRIILVNKRTDIPEAHLRTLAAGSNALVSSYTVAPTEFETMTTVAKMREEYKQKKAKETDPIIIDRCRAYFKEFTKDKYGHFVTLINVSNFFF